MKRLNELQSFREIFDAHADEILAISYTYVKDWGVAEDITQEVFANFWQKHEQFRHESSLKTYLTRAAINRAKDYLKSWRYRTHLITNRFTSNVKDKSGLVEHEEHALLANAVFELPVELREIIILYFYQDYTFKEVSEILQTPETTVKNRMKKAKELLRQQLPNESWEVLAYE